MARAKQDLGPVYLILSPQQFLLDQAVERLQKRVAEVVDIAFNSQTFDADRTPVDSVIAACNTLPFMSEKRLVLVRGVDKYDKESMETLTAYVAHPAETTVLAMTAAKMAKNLRLYKAVDAAGGIVERKAPNARELPGRVRELFADRGREIGLDGAEALITAAGTDLVRLSAEIDKIASFVGDRTQITRADIAEVVATTAPASIFDFTGAIADKDAAAALRVVANLVDDGQSVHGLHAMAVRTIRELITTRSLIDRGQGNAGAVVEALKLFGRDWLARKLLTQARNFSADQLVEALRGAAEAEAQMKTSRAEPRLVLERWIVKTCSD